MDVAGKVSTLTKIADMLLTGSDISLVLTHIASTPSVSNWDVDAQISKIHFDKRAVTVASDGYANLTVSIDGNATSVGTPE